MKDERESDDGNGVWSIVIIVVAAVLAAGFFLPVFSSPAKRGVLTENLNNAKQVATALHMYAGDHEDEFPKSLQELMPKYCTSNAVLMNTVADHKTKVPWQYFPGHKINEEPRVIVITSAPDPKGNRVVGYSDGRVEILWK